MSGTVSDFTEHVQRRELKVTKSGIENSAFASCVVVNQKPDCLLSSLLSEDEGKEDVATASFLSRM